MQPVSFDAIRAFGQRFERDPLRRVSMNAVVKNGLLNAAETFSGIRGMRYDFSVELPAAKITNQKNSGRCWLFAGLNTMRLEVMKKCNLENFELSQSYMMFWDKLEKSNFFLENVISTVDEPVGSRLLDHLLLDPVQDGGQWDMFVALVEKYGVVPKDQMPEAFHSGNTRHMAKFLTLKLREGAQQIRGAAKAGETKEQLQARKMTLLEAVYAMLCTCLGTPPQRFDFEYRDKDKNFAAERNLTPQAFCQKYVGQTLADYVSVINAPTQDKPYMKTFTVKRLGNVAEGRQIKYLNLESSELKRLAIAQLEDGQPVWFGCDVAQWLCASNGAMSLSGFDFETVLGASFTLDKAQRLDYRESVLTHAMVFMGVNLVDGAPNRWKVENSWGDKSGHEGWYIMSDDWFDQYNYQVVVNKKYLTPEQRAAYEQAPIELEPWDPFGSLALMD